MHTEGSATEVKALGAAEEPLEAMMRRIIAESISKSTESKRTYSQLERDAYKRGRQDAQGDRHQYQERQRFKSSTKEQGRNRKLNLRLESRPKAAQGRGQGLLKPKNNLWTHPTAAPGVKLS